MTHPSHIMPDWWRPHFGAFVMNPAKSRRPKMQPKVQRLDPELILKLCKKFHGYDGAHKALAEQGLKNPDTGKPFSKNAIVFAAKKADGFKDWRSTRERERKDTATEFKRIAKLAMATKTKKRVEAQKE